MNSLPTIQKQNLDIYWEVIRVLDPELYLIKVALVETQVNPMLVPQIVRAIANLAYGSGFGKIQIFMEDGVVSAIKPEESNKVGEPALIDSS